MFPERNWSRKEKLEKSKSHKQRKSWQTNPKEGFWIRPMKPGRVGSGRAESSQPTWELNLQPGSCGSGRPGEPRCCWSSSQCEVGQNTNTAETGSVYKIKAQVRKQQLTSLTLTKVTSSRETLDPKKCGSFRYSVFLIKDGGVGDDIL